MTTRNGKSIAIMQSNYIPWKGYFDIVAAVDELLIFDEVQYTRADWRNRNRIVSNGKVQWLTVPVLAAGKYFQSINSTEIADQKWGGKHWNTLRHSYRQRPHFARMAPLLEGYYAAVADKRLLTEVNEVLLRALIEMIELPTALLRADDVPRNAESATERLVEICLARGADTYVSGPAARAYIDPTRFERAGIELRYANYDGYPEYDQGLAQFDHHVSLLDLLFNCGLDARRHLKSLSNRDGFLDRP